MKEAWRLVNWNHHTGKMRVAYRAGKASGWRKVPERRLTRPELLGFDTYWQECTDDCLKYHVQTDENDCFVLPCVASGWELPTRWRAADTMPKWAERRKR